jgi:WG containing repeat
MPTGSFTIVQGTLKGLADHDGRVLIEPRFEDLSMTGGQWVIVKQNNRYGLLTRDGLSLLPIQFSHLRYYIYSGKDAFMVHLESEWREIEIK